MEHSLQHLLLSPLPELRVRAIHQLTDLAEDAALLLHEIISHDADPSVRCAAIANNQARIESVLNATLDCDRHVRLTALQVLVDQPCPHPQTVAGLMKAMSYETDEIVVHKLLDALNKIISHPAANVCLREMLTAVSPIPEKSQRTTSPFLDTDLQFILYDMVEHTSALIRCKVVQLLGTYLCLPKASSCTCCRSDSSNKDYIYSEICTHIFRLLKRLIYDNDMHVRCEALQALSAGFCSDRGRSGCGRLCERSSASLARIGEWQWPYTAETMDAVCRIVQCIAFDSLSAYALFETAMQSHVREATASGVGNGHVIGRWRAILDAAIESNEDFARVIDLGRALSDKSCRL